MSKFFDIIIVITAIIGTIIAIMALTGKNVASGAAGLVSDSFGGIGNFLPTDAAEIMANPDLVKDAVAFHDPTTDVQKSVQNYSPGTYVAAVDPVYGVPLAFAVVGGVDNTPKTQTLFGDQAGYGGISAGGGSAGASGSRPGGTGSWSSSGYTTRY